MYSVVLVVSDRVMSDFETASTIQSIQRASEQPLSIVFIGGLSAIVEEQQPLPTLPKPPTPPTPPPPRSVPSTRSIRSYSTQSTHSSLEPSSSSVASLSSSTIASASAADNMGPPLSEQSCTALNAHCSRQIFSFVR